MEAGTAFFLDPSSGTAGVVAPALAPGAGVAFDSEPFSAGEPSVAGTTAGVEVCEVDDLDGTASLWDGSPAARRASADGETLSLTTRLGLLDLADLLVVAAVLLAPDLGEAVRVGAILSEDD